MWSKLGKLRKVLEISPKIVYTIIGDPEKWGDVVVLDHPKRLRLKFLMKGRIEMTGYFEHTLDSKGRLFMPAKYRETLSSSTVHVTVGLDGCLFCFNEEEWTAFKAKIADMPMVARRKAERTFIGCSSAVDLDGQGRILIPVRLRERAELTQEITIVGLEGRIEFWDTAKWNAYSSQDDEAEMADMLEELGF